MITIHPIPRALVPIDSDAAMRVSAPNYDEFQGDWEIWEYIQAHPDSVLSVTMAHCDTDSGDETLTGDSTGSLAKAAENMGDLLRSDLTREVRDVLFVYEITGPQNPGVRQIGLGGMAVTAEIRTEETPTGPIIRNEGVREPKARGRANLIGATDAIIGTVSNAVPDTSGRIALALETHADAWAPDLQTDDEHGNTHRIWLVSAREDIERMQALFEDEPEAYVADGNHRSAAAAMLGHEHFLTLFFTADRLGISPYNRLVRLPADVVENLDKAVATYFETGGAVHSEPYQPQVTRHVGVYSKKTGWLHLRPLPLTFDPKDAAESIDHDIVQRTLFAKVFGISDAGDERLTFVGANKDAEWLQRQVDEGKATYAVTLAPVTMDQFIAVCRQDKMMPPKSTWFEPKIRSGLVMALIGPDRAPYPP
jgi:uncharacterized protein (DUF1015 family)